MWMTNCTKEIWLGVVQTHWGKTKCCILPFCSCIAKGKNSFKKKRVFFLSLQESHLLTLYMYPQSPTIIINNKSHKVSKAVSLKHHPMERAERPQQEGKESRAGIATLGPPLLSLQASPLGRSWSECPSAIFFRGDMQLGSVTPQRWRTTALKGTSGSPGILFLFLC